MSKEMLDVVHKRCESLQCVVRELEGLGVAAAIMGHDTLANHLSDIADSVHKSQEKIEKAVHKDIHDQVSANMAQFDLTIAAAADFSDEHKLSAFISENLK